MDIAFLVLGRFKERYVTPGYDGPAGLRNASEPEEAEMLYALLGKRLGEESLKDRNRIIRSIYDGARSEVGVTKLADVGNQCSVALQGRGEHTAPIVDFPHCELSVRSPKVLHGRT